ncbi:hypothetical protein KKD20_02970 [Patescibacteria group bacterium]|nr:hypothetical protein [Patescibacteria group bacterium]
MYEQNEQMVDLATCFHNKSLPLRHILALLNLAKRVVQKANEYCEQKIETDLEARLAKIIKNWFKTDIKEMLPEILYLVEEAARISFTAPFSFADAIKDKVSYVKLDEIVGSSKNRVKNSNNNVFFTSFAYNKLFTDLELTPKEALEASLKMYKKFKMPGKKEEIPLWITVQPYLASVNLTAYFCLEGGLLADRFRKDIFFSGDKFPVLDYPVIAKRTRLIAGLVDHYIPREGQGTQGKGILFGASFFNYLYRDETLKRKLLIRYIKREYFQKLVMLFKNNQR